MAKEALLKIVSAEKEADTLIKVAREEAKSTLEKAEKKSKAILEESYVKAKVQVDKIKKEARDSMKDELDQIHQFNEERCKSIKNIDQAKFDEAKKLLVERIVR